MPVWRWRPTTAAPSARAPRVQTTHTNSTAVGTGATTTRANQVMVGTTSTTYTMAGITSVASQTAQGAPTHIVTSNATGDLAAYTPAALGLATSSDVAGLKQRDQQLETGIAIALALEAPDLRQGQTFAVRGGWGTFEGTDALGFSAAGLIGTGMLGPTSSLVVDAGIGVGTSDNTTAGRAGVTLGW